MSGYKINVLTLRNELLTFHVKDYKIENGLIQFFDERKSKNMSFPVSNCEIEEDK